MSRPIRIEFTIGSHKFNISGRLFTRKSKYPIQDIKYSIQRVVDGFSDYDLLDINDWFLTLMPKMLKRYRDECHGYPVYFEMFGDDNSSKEEVAMEAWQATLDRIIFCLQEANEETCSKTNKYQEEFDKAFAEFEKKYGVLGEKLLTQEEVRKVNETGNRRAYFLSDIPEYEELCNKYFESERALAEYREDNRMEAMKLLTKWFPSLYD